MQHHKKNYLQFFHEIEKECNVHKQIILLLFSCSRIFDLILEYETSEATTLVAPGQSSKSSASDSALDAILIEVEES